MAELSNLQMNYILFVAEYILFLVDLIFFVQHVAAFIRVLIARSKLDPSPFWSKRIAFIDFWYFGVLVHDYNQFMLKPK